MENQDQQKQSILQAREKIDEIDAQMAKLFEQRMTAVCAVSEYKRLNSLPVLDSGREQKVLEKNKAFIKNQQYLPYYDSFLRDVMDISKQYQRNRLAMQESAVIADRENKDTKKYGFQGSEGSYSALAVKKRFGGDTAISAIAYEHFEDVFNAVSSGEITSGVLPFENSYTGQVSEVLELLLRYDDITADSDIIDLKVSHCLLGVKGTSLNEIKTVYSHPQALAQCSDFLNEYKIEGIPHQNTAFAAKEAALLSNKAIGAIASSESAKLYGLDILKSEINTSKENTTRFIVIKKLVHKTAATKILQVRHKNGSYPVIIKRGALYELNKYANLKRKIFLVTDDGVPRQYLEAIQAQAQDCYIASFKNGEESKNIDTYSWLLQQMLANDFTRGDLVIALGGGVVGDLAGFAASSYMRGLEFLNVPTTTLAQIDSSIGGKTGIDFAGTKNSIGAFHQPIAVIIDSDLLKTLPKRHYNNGLIEAVKAGIIYDEGLFSLFESESESEGESESESGLDIDEVIFRSLCVKKAVVEQDEGERGLRRILNFGHTLGHAVESASLFPQSQLLHGESRQLLHGEAVALGMLPMLDSDELKARVTAVLKRLQMPLNVDFDRQKAFLALTHDKKSTASGITTVRADKIGHVYCKEAQKDELKRMLVML